MFAFAIARHSRSIRSLPCGSTVTVASSARQTLESCCVKRRSSVLRSIGEAPSRGPTGMWMVRSSSCSRALLLLLLKFSTSVIFYIRGRPFVIFPLKLWGNSIFSVFFISPCIIDFSSRLSGVIQLIIIIISVLRWPAHMLLALTIPVLTMCYLQGGPKSKPL